MFLRGERDGAVERRLATFRQFVQTADRLEPHAVLHQRGRFLGDKMLEQRPERRHFRLGPLPVLRGKGIDGEELDAQLHARLRDGAHGFRAVFVAFDPRQIALPAPSVHCHP